MSEPFDKKAHSAEILKSLIKRLHKGESAEQLKEEFKGLLQGITSTEIAQIEEDLIREGMPREEVQKLCDVHLAVFRESLEKEETLAPAGHPIHILMEEHKIILHFADELVAAAKEIKIAESFESATEEMERLRLLLRRFKESESHYLREENVLFPYLEKHGVTQPPAIMWMDHNKIREIKKSLYGLVDSHKRMSFSDFSKQLQEIALALADMLSMHFHKENNILFPTALRVFAETEWPEVRHQFDDIGYCSFTPEQALVVFGSPKVQASQQQVEGVFHLETGELTKEQVEAIFNALPGEVTFVDKDDTVRYYAQPKERIFLRTPAVIGRTVQQCHPEKSVHVVNKLLEDFKSGRRDVAAFWINMQGRLIHIRYFAVRGKNGDYLGCIETTEDITEIKKIEGEKKLLD